MGTRTKYVSIDIETSGLDPEYCQILEFGAVIEDWVSPIDELRIFHCYVTHDRIVGEPFGLQMNQEILHRIATRKNNCYTHLPPDQIAQKFLSWLVERGITDGVRAFTPAGKNFSGFDRQFIKKLPGFKDIRMHHRAIDPAMLFWNPDTDDTLPDSLTCLKRAGIEGSVTHKAIDDAKDVIREIRAHFGVVTLVADIPAASLVI